MPRILTYLTLLGSLLALIGCSGQQPRPAVIKNADDPLIDSIYHSKSPARIAHKDLFNRMVGYDVIYLGENHDNVHQHRIQLQAIQQLVERGLSPAIGFEFFSRPQTSRLLQFMNSAQHYHQADSNHAAEKLLRSQLGWGDNRDADWDHLFPILQYAREHKLTVFGADLTSGLRRQLSRQGYDGLSAVEKLQLPASDFDNDDYREYMYQSFTAAHCGWGKEDYLVRLYETWLARNEAMAESIVATLQADPDQPVVVIMGGGHSQYNMAVYERVARRAGDVSQLNLRLLSVQDSPIPVSDYFAPLRVGETDFGAPYEYIWFTPRMPEREDPCKAFLKYKNKHGQHGKQQAETKTVKQ